MSVIGEPLTVFAVVMSNLQGDFGLPWLIGTSVVCGASSILIVVDLRGRRRSRAAQGSAPEVQRPQSPR